MPNPKWLGINMAGQADQGTVSIWTVSMRLVIRFDTGPLIEGWQTVALPMNSVNGISNGVYYVTVQASRGQAQAQAISPARFVELR